MPNNNESFQHPVWSTGPSTHPANQEPPFVPPRQQPSTSIPSDVSLTRKARINRDIIAWLKTPAPTGNTNTQQPTSFRGIGLYTHVKVPSAPLPQRQQQQQQQQQLLAPEPCMQFLPLGGPRRVQRTKGVQAELPESIRQLYGEMRDALEAQERAERDGKDGARRRMSALGVPDVRVPAWGRRGGGADKDEVEDVETGGVDGGAVRGPQKEGERKRESIGGNGDGGGEASARQASGASAAGGTRRSSAPAVAPVIGPTADAVMGGTEPESDKPPPPPARAATGGTTYDASRDPRRRGR